MEANLKISVIEAMDWPENSTDPNPIQPFWLAMDDKFAKKKQATKIKLKESIIRVMYHAIGLITSIN